MNRIPGVSVALVAALVLLAGCSSQKAMIGSEEIVDRSGGKPDLVKNNQWSEMKHDPYRFVGMASRAKDLDVAIRQAEIAARQRIVESVVDSLRSIGSLASSGAPSEGVGRYLQDVFTWVAGSTEVVGSHLKQSYWEKIAKNLDPTIQYAYQAYAIVEIPKADFLATKVNALQRAELRAKADQNAEAEAIVRRALESIQAGDKR